MKMKFKIGFLASVPLTTDTELMATTVKFQQSGERLERVGGERERDQYRACLQTVADETGQEYDPRTRHCLLPHPTNRRMCAGLQCYNSNSAADGDGSVSRGRSSSTSSSESSITNSGDSISFNSTNSSGSTSSTGNSFASSSAHNSDSTCVKTNNTPAKRLFTYGPKNEIRKRRLGPGNNCLAGKALPTTTTTSSSSTACLKFTVNGKADTGGSVTKGVNLKTNSLSSNSSYESQTSSNSSTKSFRKLFHRGNVFSRSLRMRTSSKKSSKNKNDNITSNNITTTTTTTISNSSNITNSNLTENSRFLLPADSVTNIVVVGDKGVGKSAITVRFLTRRYIGEYSSDSEMMYQHDTTVDHAPACLQLLDVTTMQTPYQILNYLSWAHAFVVVYDITSRTSFIHARQLLHILHSCLHTNPHLSTNFSPQLCSCKTSDYGAHSNMPHRCARNVPTCTSHKTMNIDCAFSTSKEIFRSMLPITNVASRSAQSLHNLNPTNHDAYSCYEADSPSTGRGYFLKSSLPVSSHGGPGAATRVCHRGHQLVTSHLPCYGFQCSTSGDRHHSHCQCHNLHTTVPYNTTLENYDSKYAKSSFIPSHVYYDSKDILVPEHPRFDYSHGTTWSPDEVERAPLGYQSNLDSSDEIQKCECIHEGYTNGPSLHHSYNRLLPAFGNQDCNAPTESCSPASPLRRHTTLLLGNKRDLEHIRRVWTDEGEALSLEFSCQFYEVSAAESVVGVHLAFHSLLKEARALQLIRSFPHGSSQGTSKSTVSSAVSKVIGNFFKVGKVGHKRQSNSI